MTHSNGKRPDVLVIRYGGEEILVELSFRDRNELAISVHPDCRVEVVAPSGADIKQVLERATRRAAWIVKQRRFFEQHHPRLPPPRYVSGETHRYLGRQYRLKITKGSKDEVKLMGRFFRVTVLDREDVSKVRQLLQGWYSDRARVIFAARLGHCLAGARSLELEAPRLVLRKMRQRWGSCTKAGTILLNPDLVRVPVPCIDYVIMHELCHILAHNHGPEFYRLLTRCMPDWERRKNRLDGLAI